jgi:hypothetical protein
MPIAYTIHELYNVRVRREEAVRGREPKRKTERVKRGTRRERAGSANSLLILVISTEESPRN